MPIATISFKVEDPDAYLKDNDLTQPITLGYPTQEWFKKYRIHFLTLERVNISNRFTTLVSFENINLFVEAMINYWTERSACKKYGDPDCKFQIIMNSDNEPDHVKWKCVTSILDHVCSELSEMYIECHNKENCKCSDGFEDRIRRVLTSVQTALHSILLPDESTSIN